MNVFTQDYMYTVHVVFRIAIIIINSVHVQCRYSKTNFMTVETRLDMNKQEEVHV